MDSAFATTIAADRVTAVRPAHAARRDTFATQTPLALLAIGCIVAILAINQPAREVLPSLSPGAPLAATVALPLPADAPAQCTDCGEVVGVSTVSLHPDVAPTIKTFQLEVRLPDGSVRTVRQFAPVLEVGTRVRLSRTLAEPRG